MEETMPSDTQNKTDEPIVFNVNEQTTNDEPTRTILGNMRQNPFTIEKMAEAHRNLYNSSVNKMPTTHLYVKFEPQNLSEFKMLEKTGEFFYDFPLEYEIIELGDYYQETPSDQIPELYAVVEKNFVFPNVAHTSIAELYLDTSDPLLIAESYRITGNVSDFHDFVSSFNGTPPNEQIYSLTHPIPPEPDCEPGCTAILQIDDNYANIISYIWVCDCYFDPPPPPAPYVNGCGCEVFPDQRKPGGCVRVEDTELSSSGEPGTFEPIRSVKVIVKDNWFEEAETMTDIHGCWKINEQHSGKIRVWVKFENDRCSIRGAANNWRSVWEWSTTVKDYVGRLSQPFNNIEVNYHMWGEQGSQAHRYWGAATVNNAVHEFHDYANQDGINPPPNNLDIYIGLNDNAGYALMSAQNVFSTIGGATLGAATFWTGPFAPIIAFFGMLIIQEILPDVHISVVSTYSDRVKSHAYHELAHASHFSQVGPIFWEQLVYAEVFANGHGDQNSNSADLIAVCESWASHIGLSYAHRKYGEDDNSIALDWQVRLERTWNERENHIPVGLYHDLIDTGIEPESCNQQGGGCTTVVDNVSGFTNSQMFFCLTSSVGSMAEFQECLMENHLDSTTNSVAQVDALFDSY